jgi:HTH-type transcriptional regulator, sugar sensing transcriptional regulator
MKERMRPLLGSIGFSGLEIDVYLALLEQPNASGYHVAQKIGKLVGSTYKALDSLRAKGAVVVNETTRPTTYVALSISEYMDTRRRDLEDLQVRIEREMEDMAAQPAHGGIFELDSIAQVYERCRNLLRGAKDIALLNIDARPLEELRSELVAAADRGVKVLVKTRAPARIPGCGVMAPEKAAPADVQSGDELGVTVDYREYVQAFIKSDGSGVEEAIWVRQPRLARQVCYLFQSDFTLTKVRAMVQAGKEIKEIGREMTRLTRMAEVQALPELLPQEWVLTDARKGIQKRRKALAAGTQVESGATPSQVKRVTLREIEYIMVATSRTIVMESADLAEPNKPQPGKPDLPALDSDAYIEPLY